MKLIRIIGAAFALINVVALHDLDDKIISKARPYAALFMIKKSELDIAANMALASVMEKAQAKATQQKTDA